MILDEAELAIKREIRAQKARLKAQIEERVKKGGGSVADENTLCVCVLWDDKVDLDIHCKLPNGTTCSYSTKNPTSYINLDVDKGAESQDQVENIVLKGREAMDGEYQYFVRYYKGDGKPCKFKFLVN